MAQRQKRIHRETAVPKTSNGIRLPWRGWVIPRRLVPVLVVVAVLVITTGVVMAGVLTLHRTVNVNIIEQSMTVTPETDQTINMSASSTGDLPEPYTVYNASSTTFQVGAVVTAPSGVTVSFSPALPFTLASHASQNFVVTITTAASPVSGTIDIAWANSLS